MNRDEPVKIAIVGGGCAAMAAAFELTRPRTSGATYEVTVFQQGWRLGGKGAAGRGPADRIEEHGLHVWLGFYENAFRLMRECYAELDRDPDKFRIANWRDAFVPDPGVGVMERAGAGEWRRYLAQFDEGPREPGDPDYRPLWIPDYVARGVALLRMLLSAVRDRENASDRRRRRGEPLPPSPESSGGDDDPDALADVVLRLLKTAPLGVAAAAIEAVRFMEKLLGSLERHAELFDRIASGAQKRMESAVTHDPELRRLWEMIDLILAIVRGCVWDGLATGHRGLDAIDDEDCRAWLRRHGASEKSVNSAIVTGLYDLALAYHQGDVGKPALAAGQAIRGAFRMFFTYRGSLFWKMQAGMGDTVFAPFYEVLRRRGVHFRFFHRLENVKLGEAVDDERLHVEALEFDVQARVKDGGGYEPLIDVRGLPCWPSSPRYELLDDGERFEKEGWSFESYWDRRKVETKTLRVGEDFDGVVLAVGGGAVPAVCGELVARDPKWRDMVAHLNTVETQAFQIWLREDAKALGWDLPRASVSAFTKPFDTWADMEELIPEESWKTTPRTIAYFCGVLPCGPVPPDRGESDYPERRRAEVRQNAVRFLNESVRHLWPKASRGERFRWSLLVDPRADQDVPGPGGDERFDSQYWTANVNPTDRYVLALPGTTRYRISPLYDRIENFTVAGDWTSCGFNEGCVEAAVMSGRLAAYAISGRPRLDEIVGYDHP